MEPQSRVGVGTAVGSCIDTTDWALGQRWVGRGDTSEMGVRTAADWAPGLQQVALDCGRS